MADLAPAEFWRRWWWRKHPSLAALVWPPPRSSQRRAKRRCSVKGCGRAVVARGNCHRHYTAARRTARKFTKPKDVPKVAARAVAEGVTQVLPKTTMPHALGRGVCSSCDEVKPLFRFPTGIMCRECHFLQGEADRG